MCVLSHSKYDPCPSTEYFVLFCAFAQVTALSELFVYWNDSVTDAEDYMNRIEKEGRERAKTAFE